MEKRDRGSETQGFPIQTTQDVISRTMKTLIPKVKGRGAEGFAIAANLAVELGTAMKQDGRILK